MSCCRRQELYNVEEVLGRDAAAVFPSLSKELDPAEQLRTAVGAKKFVTETEVLPPIFTSAGAAMAVDQEDR